MRRIIKAILYPIIKDRLAERMLAEFQRMQKQMICDGSIEVRVYCDDGGYWSIKVTRFTFTPGNNVKTRDYVEWTNYGSVHGEQEEQVNERLLAEFKNKFNLK